MTRQWMKAPEGGPAPDVSVSNEEALARARENLEKIQDRRFKEWGLSLGLKLSDEDVAKARESGNSTGSSSIASPLSEESFMASHRQWTQREKAQELMKRPGYDSKTRMVYHSVDNPPTCSHPGCNKSLTEDIMIRALDGSFYCLEHAPHLPGHQEEALV